MGVPQETSNQSQDQSQPQHVDGPGDGNSQPSSPHSKHAAPASLPMSPINTLFGRPHASSSAGISEQNWHHSAASDISSDRVFPIRSVVSVNTAPGRSSTDNYLQGLSDSETRPSPVNRPGASRGADGMPELRRPDTFHASSTSNSPSGRLPGRHLRKSTVSGAIPGHDQRTSRRGSVAPLQLDIDTSDKGTDESGALGGNAPVEERSVSVVSGHQSVGDMGLISARVTHAETEDGHMVITGRDGVLQRCEDEPIHAPGAVQGFGALLALREESDGRFIVRYVSENSERLLGQTPKQLFMLKNFLDILSEEQQDNLLDHIDFIRDEEADPSINGPEVFSLSIRPPKKRSIKLWTAIHINPAHPDLVICEFELDDDHEFPLRPMDDFAPGEPQCTLNANPTQEELEESTEVLSKPLRILRSARKRRGEQGAMQVFDIMSQVQEQLASASNLEAFLKILVGIVKELTGFHRVMIYQFDSSYNGKVVTELVDAAKTKDLYKGLNFPASDIPRQARDLYKLNKVRLLYDRDQETARIVCRSDEDLETPLDMSHAYLRAMSPIHIKYLANMAVRSSMSISINAFNDLWGLIACHSYGNHGMRVSFPIRKMCRLVGDMASRNIERLSYASRLQARKLINTASSEKNPAGTIVASSEDLIKLFDADFGILSIKGETKIMGEIEQSQEALVMLEYLRMRKITSVLASQDVREDFPDLHYPLGFQVIAGLLYVPLSVGGNDFIVFFRKGQIKEVKWAGNPYEKAIRNGTAGYLEPRTSFQTWHETVVGKCREWNEEQVETAAVLCLVYGKFIEVWRQKEAALQSSKLTRLLLANSAHEVRTPLNAIINYLEIALEGTLDNETRENLARSHSASKSLIYVINDLLDLAQAEGQNLIKDEVFELTSCIKEATEPFLMDAKRKGIQYDVIEHPGLPKYVYGDARRVRQALSNVMANAVAHTNDGFVKIEVFVTEVTDTQAVIDFVVEDSGIGMSNKQLDALFRDLEQVSTEEIPKSTKQIASDKSSQESRTLGLGLAVVARIVRNMDGQLRLKSEKSQGSRFVVTLPFQIPEDSMACAAEDQGGSAKSEISLQTKPSVSSSLVATPDGEITLIDRSSAMSTGLDESYSVREDAASFGSLNSKGSFQSHASHKSDAERLIDAIQTPLSLNEQELEYPNTNITKTSSKGSSSRGASGIKGSISIRSTSPRGEKRRLDSPTILRKPQPGTTQVCDSRTPVRAIKIPEDFQDLPPRPQADGHSRVLFELPSGSQSDTKSEKMDKATTESVTSGGTTAGDYHLQVLVAEDDPINMKILRKRLERAGHEVQHSVNGQDCASVYREKSADLDVVLMDMQMPIVDGLTSTKMIRALERSPDHAGHSPLAANNGRTPIFAVSASLVEREKQTYVDAGFDAWILKPIDIKRLSTLLLGIHDEEVRNSCLYALGEWERGGWFCSRSDTEQSSNDEVTPIAEEENKEMPRTGDAQEGIETTDFAVDPPKNPPEVTPEADDKTPDA